MQESMEMERSRKIFEQSLVRIADSLELLLKEQEKQTKMLKQVIKTMEDVAETQAKERRGQGMAKNAVINFRVDKKVKSDMETVCRKMGINMTTAFDFYCRKVIEEKRIPFDVDCSSVKKGAE